MQVTGTVQFMDVGLGGWALITDDGEQYELLQPLASELQRSGLKVKITGKLREDMMTSTMIGAVLAVEKFEILT